jgi:hypothetical protein
MAGRSTGRDSGNAQTEAGFVPNTLRGAYEDDFLIARLVDLVRELNRFPTQRELRLKRTADPTFPTSRGLTRLRSPRSVRARRPWT